MLGQLARVENKTKTFAAITDPRFPDYISQLVRGMAVNSGLQLRQNIFGYLNYRPTNIVVNYSTTGVAILY